MISHIWLFCLRFEASSASLTNLSVAINEAAALGANAISNGHGGSESSSDPSFGTSCFNHPGIASPPARVIAAMASSIPPYHST